MARSSRKPQRRLILLLGLLVVVVSVAVLVGKYAERSRANRGLYERPKSPERNILSKMRTAELDVKGRTFRVWLAQTLSQQRLGLMWVEPEELSDDAGMLFVFDADWTSGFWMKDTLVPLEIAFIREDGTVLDVQRMEPKSLRLHEPPAAYRYVLEVKAGMLTAAGLRAGDVVLIPPSVLNR